MGQLRVRVTPKSGADAVTGVADGELMVRVRSAPEGGKATAAACAAVAAFLGVPKSRVSLARGSASRHKTLVVEGLSSEDIQAIITSRF